MPSSSPVGRTALRGRRLDGTSPHSIRCRVAFPTPSTNAPRLSWGPAPWTKRGKRATAGPFVRERRRRSRGDHPCAVFRRRLLSIRQYPTGGPRSEEEASPGSQADHVRVPALRSRRRRPGAGRRRVRKSRVPHRAREDIPRECPVLVTLRVLDDVPPLRRAGFVRAFRESLRRASVRPGFRVVYYSAKTTTPTSWSRRTARYPSPTA